jgi:hypothetical protein
MNKMFQTDKTCSPFNGATKNMETETMQKKPRQFPKNDRSRGQ